METTTSPPTTTAVVAPPLSQPPSPPSPLQRLFLNVDFNDLSPDNLRKIVVAVAALGCVQPLAFIIYYALIADGSAAMACLLTGFAVCVVTWVGVYAAALVLSDVPEALFDSWLIGTNTALCFFVVALPQYPCVTWTCLTTTMALLCDTPRAPLHVVMAVAVYIVKEYNEAALLTSNGALATGARFGPFAENLVHRFLGLPALLGIVLGLVAFTRQHARRVQSADATVQFAFLMAQQLALYDTATVKASIAAERQQAVVDAGLLSALSVITENLDRFRPHLPDWVIETVKREGEAAAAAAANGVAAAANATTQDATAAGGVEEEVDGDLESLRNSHVGSDISDLSLNSPANLLTPHGPPAPGTPATPASTGDGSIPTIGSGRYNASGSDTSSPMIKDASRRYGASAFERGAAGGRFRSNLSNVAASIKLAVVHVIVSPAYTSMGLEKTHVDSFLGEVMNVAKATQGSVHSFIGDVVVLTWNATHRIVQSEVKVCTFLAKIRALSIQKAWPMNIGGAGINCVGQARFAGPPSGQRTMHVSIPEPDARALRAMGTLAAAANGYVVDSATATAASHAIVYRDIEAFALTSRTVDRRYSQEVDPLGVNSVASDLFVRQSPAASAADPAVSAGLPALDILPLPYDEDARGERIVIVSEVVAELGESTDEWMYVMRANDAATKREALVSQCLRACLKRNYTEALQRLDDATFDAASSFQAATLVRRLRVRIETSAQGRAGGSKFPIQVPYGDASITIGL